MDEKIPPILIKDDQVLEDEWVLISKEDVLEKKINYKKHNGPDCELSCEIFQL